MNDITKQLNRRTRSTYRASRDRRIVVSLIPGDVIGLREERTRTTFTVPIDKVFLYAARLYADKLRADKRQKKLERRKARNH